MRSDQASDNDEEERMSCDDDDDDGDVTVRGLLGLVLVCVLGIFFFF